MRASHVPEVGDLDLKLLHLFDHVLGRDLRACEYRTSMSNADHAFGAVPALRSRVGTATARVGRLTVDLKLGLFRVAREVAPDDQVRFARVTFQLQLDPGFLRRVVLAVRRKLGRATEYLYVHSGLPVSKLAPPARTGEVRRQSSPRNAPWPGSPTRWRWRKRSYSCRSRSVR